MLSKVHVVYPKIDKCKPSKEIPKWCWELSWIQFWGKQNYNYDKVFMNKTNLDKNDKHPRKGGHEKKITIFKGSQDNVQSHYRNVLKRCTL